MRTIRSIDTVLCLLALIVILLSACTPAPVLAPSPTPAPSTSTPEPVVSGPRLRIRNAGEADIKNLVVMFPDSRIEFGDVPAGTTTEYQDAPNGVYNYAAYEYQHNGETKVQPVIDWMGESPRPGQSYTYVLEFDPESENMMAINLVEVVADAN